MRLLALARKPSDPEAAAALIAGRLGITAAESRMRLMPEPPCLFARLEAAAAQALEAELAQAGLPVVGVNEPVPTDADRLLVGRMEMGPDAVALTTRTGNVRETLRWSEVALIARGVRSRTSERVTTETHKTFSPGLAVATGGMMMTRTEKRDVKQVNEESEQLIFVHAPGRGGILITDSAFNFGSLGPACKPTKLENITYLVSELRKRAPQARFDDRMLRLGRRPLPFVLTAGQSSRASVDALDAILWAAEQQGLLA